MFSDFIRAYSGNRGCAAGGIRVAFNLLLGINAEFSLLLLFRISRFLCFPNSIHRNSEF